MVWWDVPLFGICATCVVRCREEEVRTVRFWQVDQSGSPVVLTQTCQYLDLVLPCCNNFTSQPFINGLSTM